MYRAYCKTIKFKCVVFTSSVLVVIVIVVTWLNSWHIILQVTHSNIQYYSLERENKWVACLDITFVTMYHYFLEKITRIIL